MGERHQLENLPGKAAEAMARPGKVFSWLSDYGVNRSRLPGSREGARRCMSVSKEKNSPQRGGGSFAKRRKPGKAGGDISLREKNAPFRNRTEGSRARSGILSEQELKLVFFTKVAGKEEAFTRLVKERQEELLSIIKGASAPKPAQRRVRFQRR